MTIDTFTGGIFETNCYFLAESGILIDAPQESALWLQEKGHRVRLLLLTHGHIDHTWDVAAIQRAHGCTIACHAETVPMITVPDFYQKLGFMWEIETVAAEGLQLLVETEKQTLSGLDFQILEVPGHCPGSLCFRQAEAQFLFSGDTLFAGSIGRTDLPGGDHELLLRGIREKLFPLPDPLHVLSGHGPVTTLAHERRTNPFL